MQARGTDVDSRAGGVLALRWKSLSMGSPFLSRFFLLPNLVSAKMPSRRFRSPNSVPGILRSKLTPTYKDPSKRKDQMNHCSPSQIAQRTNALSLCRPESKQYLAAPCCIHPPTTPTTHRTALVIRLRSKPSGFPRAYLR